MPQPYIATKAIEINGARGYVPGDEVADDVVERFDLHDSVSRASSKAAKEATASAAKPSGPATGVSDQL